MRRFFHDIMKKRGRGFVGQLSPAQNGAVFSYEFWIFMISWKKEGPRWLGQLSFDRIGVAFFIRILVFFMMGQSANVFCRYVGLPRTEKKRRRGCRGDYLELRTGSLFSYESPLFSWYTEKKSRGFARQLSPAQNGVAFFHTNLRFFHDILKKEGPRWPANYLSTESGWLFSYVCFFSWYHVKRFLNYGTLRSQQVSKYQLLIWGCHKICLVWYKGYLSTPPSLNNGTYLNTPPPTGSGVLGT